MITLLALLPGLGIFLGTLLSEKINTTEKTNSMALHWAAGMILSVVSVQIMPEVMKGNPIWPIILAVLLGGVTALMVDKMIKKKTQGKGKWTVLFAVAVDMLSDGIAIGASSTISSNFAFMIVLGLFIGDFPEGLVNTSTLKEQETSRKFRISVSAGLSLLCILGAIGAYFITHDQSKNVKYTLIAFTAGMYIRAAVEDMVEKSHSKIGKSSSGQMAFLSGFVTYMVGNAYLEK